MYVSEITRHMERHKSVGYFKLHLTFNVLGKSAVRGTNELI